MNVPWWVWVGFMAFIFMLAAFGLLGILIRSSPHAKKVAKKQSHINAKNGTAPGAPAATPPKEVVSKISEYAGTILIALGGIVLIYWVESAGALALGSWGRAHWLAMFIACVVAILLIRNHADGDTKKNLLAMVSVVAVLFLVGLPLYSTYKDSSHENAERATRSEPTIPLASSPQATWPKLVIQGEKSEIVPRPPGMRINMAGYNFHHVAVYPDGSECIVAERECPEGSYGSYARNDAGRPNIVSYAYFQ